MAQPNQNYSRRNLFAFFRQTANKANASTSRTPREEHKKKKKKERTLSLRARASRSLNIRLRSPVRRKKLYWFYRLSRRKLSVKSNVLRWSVKHDREIRGKEKLINVTNTIDVWKKFFSFFLFQRGGVWHTCPMHPNRCDSSTVVDESSHRMSNCALT